jgi:putative ABC transport system substrate-binding protein
MIRSGRRRFLVGTAASVVTSIAPGQAPGRIPRLGIVFNAFPLTAVQGENPAEPLMREFLRGLREEGYVEGRNLVIERRTAEGQLDRLDGIVRDLAELPVDLIFVSGNAATLAARKVTSSIPIVSAGMGTPVELGIASSLAQPGGNVTGLVTAFGQELGIKRLELVRQLLPHARRIAWFGSKAVAQLTDQVQDAAAKMGMTLVFVDAQLPRVDAGLAEVERVHADALVVVPIVPLYSHLRTIVAFVASIRMPDFYGFQEAVEAGGLASYGIDVYEAWRRAARYVSKILHGAKPGALPIEQMDRYSLALNRKRARTLGITIPASVLQRADAVIE